MVGQKCTSILIITWANVDRFTKLFHCQIPDEILYIKDPWCQRTETVDN